VGEKEYASPLRHGALTDSHPSADVTLIILPVADLAVALPAERRVLARRGWAGEMPGLSEQPLGVLKGAVSSMHTWFEKSGCEDDRIAVADG
jgi:hypothetical protein